MIQSRPGSVNQIRERCHARFTEATSLSRKNDASNLSAVTIPPIATLDQFRSRGERVHDVNQCTNSSTPLEKHIDFFSAIKSGITFKAIHRSDTCIIDREKFADDFCLSFIDESRESISSIVKRSFRPCPCTPRISRPSCVALTRKKCPVDEHLMLDLRNLNTEFFFRSPPRLRREVFDFSYDFIDVVFHFYSFQF